MEVICLEDDAFYTLIESVVRRIKEKEGKKEGKKEDKWISPEEAIFITVQILITVIW